MTDAWTTKTDDAWATMKQGRLIVHAPDSADPRKGKWLSLASLTSGIARSMAKHLDAVDGLRGELADIIVSQDMQIQMLQGEVRELRGIVEKSLAIRSTPGA